ncbi:MAG: EamA family transporter [Paludibacterium sp.]|uniref:EamA family transporter n=1 Tax=Paludibacterium sp. TaxID=1917523 RepID=UPI0025E406D1|nr:EamA family transporter [Paludibacterium sp.]MBV8049465.1 EamA family transporter [Paludibacterium sp.]MBV8648727.1 EamA family transporter [Paludibacterium sp.]
MQTPDILQALLVIVLWGFNFVVIKWGVADVPPLLLGCLRFSAVAFAGLFWVARPRLPWRWLALYGLTVGFGQFAGLFCAIKFGMPAGLASVVLQSQAFFTMLFAALLLREHWRVSQLTGLLLAAAGLGLIGATHGANMTLLGFVLTLIAASSWAMSNVVVRVMVRRGMQIEPLGLVVWSALVPPLPFLAMSLWLEGGARDWQALTHFSWGSLAAVAYLALAASMLGYGIWSRLLSRYPANSVAPFSLLAPLVALVCSMLLLGEQLTAVQALGSVLLLAGLVVNVLGGRVANFLLKQAR